MTTLLMASGWVGRSHCGDSCRCRRLGEMGAVYVRDQLDTFGHIMCGNLSVEAQTINYALCDVYIHQHEYDFV